MSAPSSRLLALTLVAAFAMASLVPAAAKTANHRHKQPVAAHHAGVTTPGYRGASQFPCEVYSGDIYLGTDLYPFIRSQILRTYEHDAF
jgi:hypothetical protein